MREICVIAIAATGTYGAAMKNPVVIIGATSENGRELCKRLASRGSDLVLAGRNLEALEALRELCRMHYKCESEGVVCDASSVLSRNDVCERCVAVANGSISGIIVCQGYTPSKKAADQGSHEQRMTIDINCTSVVMVPEAAARYFAHRKSGFIAAMSSVAGDRGRQVNYVYGAAKGALATYMQGLRCQLWDHGVHVLTIKPGVITTPATMKVYGGRPAFGASPRRVASDIEWALQCRVPVLYTPWWWRWVMCIVCILPNWLCARLGL